MTTRQDSIGITRLFCNSPFAAARRNACRLAFWRTIFDLSSARCNAPDRHSRQGPTGSCRTPRLSRDQDSYGLLDYTAEAMGKLCISTELGGSGVVDPSALLIGDFGVRSLLKHLDVLIDDLPSTRPSRLLEMNENSIARSPSRGVYEPIVTLGTAVCQNETLGFIHRFDAVEAEPVSICSKITGLGRAQGVCRPGDTLGIVASDISSQTRKALLD
jgi:predicted deacylase